MWNTELLCIQCREIGPHVTVRGMSHGFSQVAAGTWGIFSSYNGNSSSKLVVVQQRQDTCLVVRDTSGSFSRLGRAIGTSLEVRQQTQFPLLNVTVIFGFLSIVRCNQASSPLEALTPMFLSSSHRHIGVPVEIRRETSAFSRVCKEDSDICSSCEIKHEPAFKSLQGNLALF